MRITSTNKLDLSTLIRYNIIMQVCPETAFELSVVSSNVNSSQYLAEPLKCSEYRPEGNIRTEIPIGVHSIIVPEHEQTFYVLDYSDARKETASTYGVSRQRFDEHRRKALDEVSAIAGHDSEAAHVLRESGIDRLFFTNEDLYIGGIVTRMNTLTREIRSSLVIHRTLLDSQACLRAFSAELLQPDDNGDNSFFASDLTLTALKGDTLLRKFALARAAAAAFLTENLPKI
jgi:hypothetical protein